MLIDLLQLYSKPPKYQLTLCKPNKEPVAILEDVYNIIHTPYLASTNELSFDISIESPYFDIVKGKYLILLELINEEDGTIFYQEYYIINKTNRISSKKRFRHVECLDLSHQLTKKNIRSFSGVKKIYRTPDEISSYTPSELYPTLEDFTNSGILNYVVSLIPSWSIGTVDEEINSKFRDVQVDMKSILDFLLSDVQHSFDCIFQFDTINKVINVKKIDSLGINKGLFISEENYIKTFGESIDFDEVVTRLNLYGKDGLSIHSVNPVGTSYIDNLSYFRNIDYMSQGLLNALDNYDNLLQTKQTEFKSLLSDLNTYINQLAIKQDELDILEAELEVLKDTKDAKIQAGEDLTQINQDIANKEIEIQNKQSEIDSVQNNIDSTNASIQTLRNEITVENNFTSDQIKELDNFIFERDYIDNTYIDAEELYNEGYKILSRINQPPVEFEIGVVDFLNIVECQHDWDKLRVGDIININYSKFNIDIELRLINYTHDVENNNLSLKFSNKSSLNDPNMALEEILENTISTTTSLDINRFKFGRYEDSGERSELLNYINSELNLTAQKALAGNNQNIEVSKRGIICKDTTNDLEQIRILNNLIVLTTDGFQTADVAISPQGVIAEKIFGKLGAFCTVSANQITVGDSGEKITDDLIDSATDWNGAVTKANNSVQQNTFYNRVIISTDNGIQVLDLSNNERVKLGDLGGGKYGLLLKDSSGNKTILDEDGILQTWQEGKADNVDSTHPLKLNIYIPSNTKSINKVLLRFKLEPFRAYSTGAASGGGSTETTAGSGDHRHLMMEWLGSVTSTTYDGTAAYAFRAGDSAGNDDATFYIKSPGGSTQIYTKGASGDHTHDVIIPSHTHDITYEIYESTTPRNITIKINGIDRTSILGGSFNTDQNNLDISSYMLIGQWNTVELGSSRLGRIDATVFIQALMGV